MKKTMNWEYRSHLRELLSALRALEQAVSAGDWSSAGLVSGVRRLHSVALSLDEGDWDAWFPGWRAWDGLDCLVSVWFTVVRHHGGPDSTHAVALTRALQAGLGALASYVEATLEMADGHPFAERERDPEGQGQEVAS